MGKHAGHKIADIHGSGSLLQECQAHEEEREAEDEFADTLPISFSTENKRHTDSQQGDGEGGNVHLEPDGRDDPRCHCRTDVGTHNDTDGLGERHQSGIHKTNHHHCGGTR